MNFVDSLKKRRSIYALGKNIDNGDEVVELIKDVVRHSPYAFNAATTRILVLTGEAQDKLWGQIVPTSLKAEMDRQGAPESAWEGTKAKLEGFKAAYGTVLFFEDQAVVKNLQENFPLYADNFPHWSEQHSGITSINTWTALAQENIGANLQHYNPVIDEAVAKEWNIPANWKLRSQLVFGSIEDGSLKDKDFMADEERFIVVK